MHQERLPTVKGAAVFAQIRLIVIILHHRLRRWASMCVAHESSSQWNDPTSERRALRLQHSLPPRPRGKPLRFSPLYWNHGHDQQCCSLKAHPFHMKASGADEPRQCCWGSGSDSLAKRERDVLRPIIVIEVLTLLGLKTTDTSSEPQSSSA